MSNEKSVVLLSENSLPAVLSAVKTLHCVFGEGLPPAEQLTEDQQREVLSRAWEAIGNTAKAKRTSIVQSARASVNAIIEQRRAAAVKAHEELASLSTAARALLGSAELPNNILIPLTDLKSCFPADTAEPQMVKLLHDMGYRLAQGKTNKAGVRLSVPLKVATVETVAAPVSAE